MTLRFFGVIWGSMVSTLLLIILIAVGFEIEEPDHEQEQALQTVIATLAQGAVEAGADAEVRDFLENDSVATRILSLVERPHHGLGCTSTGDITEIAPGTCLSLVVVDLPRTWAEQLLPFMIPLITGLAVSFAAALFLARWLARPLSVVSSGLTDLAAGRLERRIGPEMSNTDYRLANLGTAFDRAASQLQTLADNRTRLFHDVSHEIRSPLARLQVAIALLRKNPARIDPMLGRMETDIERMDQLVDEILTLAQFQKVNLEEHSLENLDLVELLEPILSDAQFEGQSQDVSCRYEGPNRLVFAGHSELLHRAFENIVRNAVRHSEKGSEVLVRVQSAQDMVSISVEDRGPGVDPTEIERIFNPFDRGSSPIDTTGAGLGLSIADCAIRLHQGTISAANRKGGGLVVDVTLPLQK